MKVNIELTQEDLKNLVSSHISMLTNLSVDILDIQIQTKSAQNYKAEWEQAEFRATYNKIIK